MNMEAASGHKGFFQPLPKLKNQFLYDPSIRRIFKCKRCSGKVTSISAPTLTNTYKKQYSYPRMSLKR